MTPALSRTLAGLPRDALPRASRALADAFGRAVLISTLHEGPRCEDEDAAETRGDLDALAEALPEGRLSTAVRDRDAASPEPAMLTAIRQAEGAPPRLPAVLLPRGEDEAQALLAEASAAGFEPDAAPPRRPIGLAFWADARAGLEGGTARVGAGTSWAALEALADRHGLAVPSAVLSNRYPAPVDAVAGGLVVGGAASWFRGQASGASLPLSPGRAGATDRAWLVPADAAGRLAEEAARLYAPLYVETLPPLDATVLHASGLLARPPKGRALLRVACEGPRRVRAALVADASWMVRRAGGVLCWRGTLPGEDALTAIAAACGAARFALPGPAADPPPAAVQAARVTAVRGHVQHGAALWYPRDLSRSIEQAEDALGRPRPAAPVPTRTDDDGWEALRAALAEALP